MDIARRNIIVVEPAVLVVVAHIPLVGNRHEPRGSKRVLQGPHQPVLINLLGVQILQFKTQGMFFQEHVCEITHGDVRIGPRLAMTFHHFLVIQLEHVHQGHLEILVELMRNLQVSIDEIDIVGLYAEKKKALVAEVKRQSKNFKPDLFAHKVEELRKKVLFKYEIESRLLSMEDM